MEEKEKLINLNISGVPLSLVDDLKRISKEDLRSLSQGIVKLLFEAVEARKVKQCQE